MFFIAHLGNSDVLGLTLHVLFKLILDLCQKELGFFCVGVNQSRGYATREVVSSWFIYYLAILRSVGVLIFSKTIILIIYTF